MSILISANTYACNTDTEASLLACRTAQYERSSLELEKLINKAKLSVDSQNKWLKFRDAECFLNAADSTYDVYKLYCLNEMNKKRIEELRKINL